MTHSALPPVALPAYDRSRLTPGIVHIGLGNFHRAHMAVYLDDLFAKGLAMDWAILGAGVRAGDAQMRAALVAQDCLSTVIELDPTGHRARRIGSMIGFLPVEADNAALIAAWRSSGPPRPSLFALTTCRPWRSQRGCQAASSAEAVASMASLDSKVDASLLVLESPLTPASLET